MSKASTPIKVLRTALKRVQTRWTTGTWNDLRTNSDGTKTSFVCLEGALFGGQRQPITDAQVKAHKMVQVVLKETHGTTNIPQWNDTRADQAKAEDLIKRTIIRLETGGFDDIEDMEISDEEVALLMSQICDLS